jgi:hypothetical protein
MTATTPKEIAEAAEITLRVVDQLVNYAKELQWLFAKAISMPRLAFLELEKIFAEIHKSLTAIDEATKVFFDAVGNPEGFIDNDNLMHDMSSSRLPDLVEEKRGHCHEIGNIYNRYLSGILSSLFQNPSERARVQGIFMQLDQADTDLFSELTQAAREMRDLAKRAYRFKVMGRRQEAIDLIKNAALGLLDMRDRFNDADVTIHKISNEFLKAARVAPGGKSA